MKATTKRVIIAAGVVLVVGGVLAGIKAAQIGAMIESGESFRPPPEAVTTATVEATEWRRALSAVGSVVAKEGVMLTAEASGTVTGVYFESGDQVKRGALLLRIDTAAERAQLQAARATALLAQQTLDRTEALREASATTAAALDAARARASEARGAVQSLKATIDKKTIRAPFAGRLGIKQVDLGEVVTLGSPIASLVDLAAVHTDFDLPQGSLGQLEVGQTVIARTDAFPERTWTGTVTAIDPQVDPSTRNVRLRATFDNADETLRPGMFATVEVVMPEQRRVLVIPATAVVYAPYGDSVFLVARGEDGGLIAKQTFVRLGDRRGDLVSVARGLREDQVVVSNGAFKLRNGAPIVERNELAPPVSATPRPPES
jgi:membrane fusion protein (multidrug efflux system)